MNLAEFCAEWCGKDRRLAIYSESRKSVYQDSHVLRYPEQRLARLLKDEKPGLYVSVNPYDPETMRIRAIERLYFDFDCKEKVRYALEECVTFCESLVVHYSVSPLVLYSGSKGYAVYVFLQEPVVGPEDELHELYRELQEMLVAPGGYRWLDPQPLGDLKRVSRVPFSRHQKTGDLCVPVDVSKNPPEPFSFEAGFTDVYRRFGLSKRVVEVAKRRLSSGRRVSSSLRMKHGSVGEVRPCLAEVMEASTFPPVFPGYDGHNLLIAAVVEYYYNGYSREQILGLLSRKDGFDLKTSKKMVDYVTSKYLPVRCSTIRRYGGCDPKKCGV